MDLAILAKVIHIQAQIILTVLLFNSNLHLHHNMFHQLFLHQLHTQPTNQLSQPTSQPTQLSQPTQPSQPTSQATQPSKPTSQPTNHPIQPSQPTNHLTHPLQLLSNHPTHHIHQLSQLLTTTHHPKQALNLMFQVATIGYSQRKMRELKKRVLLRLHRKRAHEYI
jgi:hypothetical protein